MSKTFQSKKFSRLKKQIGMTLIEMITSLAILALVIGGALALYSSAATSQSSTQFSSDMSAIRSTIRSAFYGQAAYGAAAGTNLNTVLISGKRVPTTMASSGSVITHSLNGTMTATGYVSNYAVALTNIPLAVCMNLLTSASGWGQVLVTTGVVQTTFPISPATAATECAKSTTVTFTSS